MPTRNVSGPDASDLLKKPSKNAGSPNPPVPYKPPVPPAPAAPPPPASYSDWDGGYDGGDYSGNGALDSIPFSAPVISDDEWLAGDSAYQAQLAALKRALADAEADFTGQKGKYEIDYGDALKGLGWRKEMTDDPATPNVNEAAPGAWNFEDLNTAAGRSFNNQQNDFASRGLLQSSLYGTANDNLTRSLNDQLGSINTGRQTFLDDLTRQQTSARNENTLSQQQARAEALARRAATMGVV